MPNSNSELYVLHAWEENPVYIKCVQGEGGIKIANFKLVDDSGSINLSSATSVTFDGIKRDGSGCCVTCNVVDAINGIVEFIEQTGVTDIDGNVKGTINVVFPDGNIKFDGIILYVAPNSTTKLIEASQAFSAFVEALNKLALITPEGTIAIDDVLTDDGVNAVQGKVIKAAIDKKLDNSEGSVKRENIEINAVGFDEIDSGAIKTANIADKAVTKEKLYDDVVADIDSKADKAEFDAEMQKIMKNVSKNVIALTSGTYSKNGITVDVNSDNHISISGTASAYVAIDIPVKCSIESGVKYVLSAQNSKSIGDNDSTATVKLRGNNVDIAMLTINYYGLTKNVTFAASVNADTLRIAIATGKTINVECDVQLEKGEEYTEFISPNSEKNYILNLALANGSVSERNLDYELQNKTSKIPNMTYLYVSNDYTSADEGYGLTKFKSLIDANESITDNDEFNRYTIVVKSGTYNEFETRYAGSMATKLEGIITKDYVYYESENINNPSECVLTWDGAYGYEAGALTNEMAVKKCIFHVVGGDYHERGMHTHIKGFTIKSKNTRYGLHKESGGYGRNVDWLIENCIIEYGGRHDVVNGNLTPVVGMGMSPFEVGEIKQCDIKYSDGVSGTRAINCHDNAETSLYKNTPAVIIGAKLNIKDCNFNNKIVGLSVKGEATSDTDYVARLENNAGISDVENTGWKVYCDTEVI